MSGAPGPDLRAPRKGDPPRGTSPTGTEPRACSTPPQSRPDAGVRTQGLSVAPRFPGAVEENRQMQAWAPEGPPVHRPAKNQARAASKIVILLIKNKSFSYFIPRFAANSKLSNRNYTGFFFLLLLLLKTVNRFSIDSKDRRIIRVATFVSGIVQLVLYFTEVVKQVLTYYLLLLIYIYVIR